MHACMHAHQFKKLHHHHHHHLTKLTEPLIEPLAELKIDKIFGVRKLKGPENIGIGRCAKIRGTQIKGSKV